MPPRIAKLAGLGALSAAFWLIVLYLVVSFLAMRPTAASGLDGTQRFLSWFTVGGVVVALALVHIMMGRRLLALSRGEMTTP